MGACSPLRIGIAIVILITMVLIYLLVAFFAAILGEALLNSGGLTAVVGGIISVGVIFGGIALIGYTTYKIGFDCDSKASNEPAKEVAQQV